MKWLNKNLFEFSSKKIQKAIIHFNHMVIETGMTDSKQLDYFYVAITALNGNASFSRKKYLNKILL